MSMIQNSIEYIEKQLAIIKQDLEDKRAECEKPLSEIADLEDERDYWANRLVDVAGIVGGGYMVWGDVLTDTTNWYDFIYDKHEKIRYGGGDYEVVILADCRIYGCNDLAPVENLADNQVFGCNDLVPVDSSIVVHLGEMDEWY